MQFTTMDQNYEIFVASSLCEDNCDMTWPNLYDLANGTTIQMLDNRTLNYTVTDANKPFGAVSVIDKICFD
jgi:hypothetical protein